MPDSDYTRTPPLPTEMQILAMGEKINDICKHVEKLSAIPQQLERMNMQLEQLSKDHQQTRNDLQQTRSNFSDELKTVKTDVSALQTGKTKLDTFTDIVQWGGIALIVGIIGSWSVLKDKVDTASAQASANLQRIEMIEKTQDQRGLVLNDIQGKYNALQLELYKRGAYSSEYETNR